MKSTNDQIKHLISNDGKQPITCRYLLFAQKDLKSKQLSQSNNKQELKIVRTSWRYQMLLKDISGEIYDTKTCQWIP